jgi:FkbM family methyltransferase
MLPRLAYLTFKVVRAVARALGLTGLLRRVAGPGAARLLAGVSADSRGRYQVNGHTMYLAAEARFPPMDMAIGRFEPQTTKLVESLIKPGMVVLDVGAHVGYFTLIAARNAGPSGTVYAFEPEPENYELLVRNIEINGYENIQAIRKGISDRTGTSELFISSLDNGRHSMYRHGLPDAGAVAIETTTVDAFLEESGWPTIDFIKMDVEGSEQEVLAGMTETFQRSPDLSMIIEFNPHLLRDAGVDPVEFAGLPSNMGFDVEIIDEKIGVNPMDPYELTRMAERMARREESVNLFCSHK